MVQDAVNIGGHSTSMNDFRLTKIGRFLRKYKIDELPQFINIIKGIKKRNSLTEKNSMKKQMDCFWRAEEIDLSKDMTDWIKLNDNELEQAKWFSRDELTSGRIKLPPTLSISRALIDGWIRNEY